MPSLDQHQSAKFVKMLLMGDSGTGKTGALVSLAVAGYKLRIIDFDNGLDIVAKMLREKHPDKLKNVAYETLRDRMKPGPNGAPVLDGAPKAWVNCIRLLNEWDPAKYKLAPEGTPSLGRPDSWGEDTILVIDSMTFGSDAAFNWAESMNPQVKDRRQIFYTAQDQVKSLLEIITSSDFKTNVIVIAHITYVERQDGAVKGYPSSVGKAQAERIPAFFNNVALAESIGTPPKRTIRTVSTNLIELKSPAADILSDKLPIETALADYFEKVRK